MAEDGFSFYLQHCRDKIDEALKEYAAHIPGCSEQFRNYFIPRSRAESDLLNKDAIYPMLDDIKPGIRPAIKLEIYDNCRVVFLILVYIGKPKAIDHFYERAEYHDDHLPFSSPPPGLAPEVWALFAQAQGRFEASTIRRGKQTFGKHAVIPFIDAKEIAEGSSAKVFRVILHSEYDELHSVKRESLVNAHVNKASTRSINKEYALKVYKGVDARNVFHTELKVFQEIRVTLGQEWPPGIIEYLAAYSHDSTGEHCLILEYAAGGDLHKLLQQPRPQWSCEESHTFWTRLSDLCTGLAKLHDLREKDSTAERHLECTHHDIHPGNILLVHSNADMDQQQFLHSKYVLADLGHASIVETGPDRLVESSDPGAGRDYAAPEACASSLTRSQTRRQVSRKADVFSLGAVLLEVAVWQAHGPDKVMEFQEARRKEAASLDAMFHDNDSKRPRLLSIVRHHLQDPTSAKHDITTRMLLDQVIRHMLAPDAEDRPRSSKLEEEFALVLKAAHDRMHQPAPARSSHHIQHSDITDPLGRSASGSEASRGRDEVALETSAPAKQRQVPKPVVTIARPRNDSDEPRPVPSTPQLFNGAPSSDTSETYASRIPSPPATVAHGQSQSPGSLRGRGRSVALAPGEQVTVSDILEYDEEHSSLIRHLFSSTRVKGRYEAACVKDRRLIFLIDDSLKMSQESRQVVLDTFRAMLRMVCSFRGNFINKSIQLHFTSDMNMYESKWAKSLVERLRHHNYSRGTTNMRECLGKLLKQCQDVLEQSLLHHGGWQEGSSIFVFTDGRWEAGMDAEQVIIDCANFLVSKNMDRQRLCVSFIMFGEDAEGQMRMQELDNLQENGKVDIDIVDCEHSAGDFWKMLTGAVNATRDRAATSLSP